MNDISEPVADATNVDIIRLGVGRPPKAICSCTWETEPMEDLFALGTAAFDHSRETGHVLRKHPTTDL